MNLLKDEEFLMDGQDKQIVLTTHRIRQENVEFGRLHLVSIMLEHVTSCEYSRKSKPFFIILGITMCLFGFFMLDGGDHSIRNIGSGVFILGFLLILSYFFTIKSGLFISSPSARIVIKTRGMKDENIKLFIDKLESAKNVRNNSLK